MTRSAAFRLAFPLLLLTACPKQPEAVTVPASGSGVLAGATVPDTEEAKAFARQLVNHPALGIKPADNEGMDFRYKTLTFAAAGNTWRAEAVVGAAGESFECEENGGWTIESAESAATALVVLKMSKTGCAGRPATTEMRMLTTIDENGKYNVQFR